LSSSFIAGPYAQGSNVITGNGMATIKMAARYIRTTGNLQAGLAKSRVEVLANYQ
jgi:type 1 fimbria pilin